MTSTGADRDPIFLEYRDRCHDEVENAKSAGTSEVKLGKGTYATIALVKRQRDDGTVVWEVEKRSVDLGVANQTTYLTILREVDALRKVKGHPNIVEILRVGMSPPSGGGGGDGEDDAKAEERPCVDVLAVPLRVSISLEYLPVKLSSYLRRCSATRGCGMTGPALFAAAGDVISAVACCHAHGILHRDVKTDNLLLTRDGTLKLVDFGLAKPVSDAVNGKEHHGREVVTLGYRPPEFFALARHAYAGDVDVWSVGVVLAELATGELTFRGSDEEEVFVQQLETLAGPDAAMPEGALPVDAGDEGALVYGPAPSARSVRRAYALDERELSRSAPLEERVGRLPFARERDRSRYLGMVREAAALAQADRPAAAALLRKYYPSRS